MQVSSLRSGVWFTAVTASRHWQSSIIALVAEKSSCRLGVAVRDLHLEVEPVGLSLDLVLRDFAAKLLCRLGVLGRLGNLDLQGCDLIVALGDGLLLVGVAHLRLLLRRLLMPDVFLSLWLFPRLCAMVIIGHVSHLSYRGR